MDARKFFKLLKLNGYKHIRTRGSHYIYNNGKNTISVPLHLNRMIAQRLMKEYNLA